jgi:hypothetical protein
MLLFASFLSVHIPSIPSSQFFLSSPQLSIFPIRDFLFDSLRRRVVFGEIFSFSSHVPGALCSQLVTMDMVGIEKMKKK